VRRGKARAPLLLQRTQLVQACRRSWAEILAASVEGREMLYEGPWFVCRAHLWRTPDFGGGHSGFDGRRGFLGLGEEKILLPHKFKANETSSASAIKAE
jgi:hypothetical protein